MTNEKSCANCRLHRAEKQPKVVGEAFDTIVEFAEEDETVYHCTVTGKRIGTEPVLCDSYAAPVQIKAELDAWEKKFLERQQARGEER